MDFAHLHLHTEYSLLDGMLRIESLMAKAVKENISTLAITDHGNVFGWVNFAKEAEKKGIKYILGCEIYIHGESRFHKERDNRHLVLLVKNDIGYKNLCILTSLATIEGYYYVGRIDYELLEKHHEGLIALSACLGGDVSKEILNEYSSAIKSGKEDSTAKKLAYKKGIEKAKYYKSIFGEDFYIEVQDNGINEQYVLNSFLIEIAKELDIEVVATNDCHYLNKEDYTYHDAFMAAGSGTVISNKNRKIYGSSEFYVKNYEQMTTPCHKNSNVPLQAVKNTMLVADKCTFKYDFTKLNMPKFTKHWDGYNSEEMVKELMFKGARERCYEGNGRRPVFKEEVGNIVYERLMFEYGVISSMGYLDYFLIVWDFCEEALRRGILAGPGRGSVGGCQIAYCLGISHIDALEHNLLFERFLNPSRVSMPDWIAIKIC